MMDAMKGTELPAAAPGPLSRSAEAPPRADEAGAILPRKRRGDVSNRRNRQIASIKTVANGHHKRAYQSRTERIEFGQKFRFEIYVSRLLWFQTITGVILAKDSVRNRVSKNVTNLGNPET